MWEPFTEPARRALVLAKEEAQRLGHRFISAEHILLGVVSTECVTTEILREHGIAVEKVRAQVERLGEPRAVVSSDAMVFSPQAKRCIEIAFEVARSVDHNYIGTEHLFLGIVRVDDRSVAMQVLAQLTTELTGIAKEIETRMREQRVSGLHRPATVRSGFEFRLIVLELDASSAVAEHEAALNALGHDGYHIVAMTHVSPGKVLIAMQRSS
jgi:ATP-dependent Clp protease ATP-binding subunit ClpC